MGDNILDAFGGSSYPAIKWADVGLGNVVSGVIIDIPSEPVKDKLDPEKTSVPIGLETKAGKETLWAGTKSQLGSAIKTAVREHGTGETLRLGGTLHVKWDSNENTGKASPMRVFKVKYEPPTNAGVDPDEIF